MVLDINNLFEYKENNRIEAKKAKSNIPNSIWETYSSFSNTEGGIILLGVSEREDHTFVVSGVEDADKMQKDFWNMINNREKVKRIRGTDTDPVIELYFLRITFAPSCRRLIPS